MKDQKGPVVTVECPSCGSVRRVPESVWKRKTIPCDYCACDRMIRSTRHARVKRRPERAIARCGSCLRVLLASERPSGICRRCEVENLVSA